MPVGNPTMAGLGKRLLHGAARQNQSAPGGTGDAPPLRLAVDPLERGMQLPGLFIHTAQGGGAKLFHPIGGLRRARHLAPVDADPEIC